MRAKWNLGKSLILTGMTAFILGLTGCGAEIISNVSHAVTNGGLEYKETLLNEQDVFETLKTNEVELTADPSDSYFKLNKKQPFIYALPDNEKIMVYVLTLPSWRSS